MGECDRLAGTLCGMDPTDPDARARIHNSVKGWSTAAKTYGLSRWGTWMGRPTTEDMATFWGMKKLKLWWRCGGL